VPPKRWIVERIFARLLSNRRLVVDYERNVQTSETLIEVALIRLLVARLGRQAWRHTQRNVISPESDFMAEGTLTIMSGVDAVGTSRRPSWRMFQSRRQAVGDL
jgi:hypothetical protein